ncbi:MAG: ABC transporter permease subunit [Clostridiales bacterium]|nr:ABC transporter permease subunit [Clostridiales bacterium]
MTKLLSANFLRLWKNKTFWVSAVICVALGVLAPLGEFRAVISMNGGVTDLGELGNLALLEVFFEYASFIGILAGAFVSLFLGTEYSDGTIRNKVMAGHSRAAIYFANLIVGFAASLMCMACYMTFCLAVGAPLLGWFTKSASLILTAIFGSVVMLAAFCAIFTFVTMNTSRKSTSVVICLLGVFVLLIAAVYLNGRLESPEYISNYFISIDGITQSEPQLNPQYLRGMERKVYQFLYDLLPTGQSMQYTMLSFTDPARLMGLGLAVAALFTGAGAALFRRKDLK